MMYDYEIEYPIQSLYIAKTFYDHDRLDKLIENLDDDVTLSWDELGWIEMASVESVFADSRCYQQQGRRVIADEDVSLPFFQCQRRERPSVRGRKYHARLQKAP